MANSNIQVLDWGQFEWIYEPEGPNSPNAMSIGIITILPGKAQRKHVHYGDEQFLYVISGEGTQLVGDTQSVIKQGAFFHIEAGSVHDTVNTGVQPIKELVISIPANYGNNLFKDNDVSVNKKKYDTLLKVNKEIKKNYDEFSCALKIPISIFDIAGKEIIGGNAYPLLCEKKCCISKSVNSCSVYRIQIDYSSLQHTEPTMFVCPHGLSVIIMPIVCNSEVVGCLKGGHFRNNEENIYGYDNNSELLNDSTQIFSKVGIIATLFQIKKLSKYIADDFIVNNTEAEIIKKEKIIEDFFQQELALRETLKIAREEALSIRINNHFLFNTLNAIASLAVREDAFKTYESVINLSKLFRYTLKMDNTLIKVHDEVDYLSNYIHLQKLRYGSKLNVNFDISDDIGNIIIPFNCLQPVLENYLVHGFKSKKNNFRIDITGAKYGENVIIEICDNGIGLKEKDVIALNYKFKQNVDEEVPLSGLMMINSKLQLHYKDKFIFEIYSSSKKGTRVKITLPEDLPEE